MGKEGEVKRCELRKWGRCGERERVRVCVSRGLMYSTEEVGDSVACGR